MPFIGAAITAISGWVAAQTLVVQALIRIALSVALGALQVALAGKPRPPGIRTTTTQTGGTNAATFILGTYGTAGFMVSPMMSHGQVGKTPNAYLTYVIDLGDIPMPQFGRLILNGEYVSLGTVEETYGLPLQGAHAGNGWLKYYDGQQTVASAVLTSTYGSYSRRPWLPDMILRGVPYAVLTFRYNRELYTSFPTVRFESPGIALYDPRKDSSVGGTGTHRWATPSTWQVSNNLVVQAYNILRGITFPDGSRWGGEATHAEVPMANWVAAMNKADAIINFSAGGSEPQYRGGFEVAADDLPVDILDELMKGCSGRITEVAGVYKIRVGAPDLPVYLFDDDDIIITDPQDYDPFPGLDQTFNAIHASYPEPAQLWESKDAPPRYNAAYEALDQNRRLPATLNLPAVPYGAQVQRLMVAYLNDQRRFRVHMLTLPPDAAILEPLDTVSWTSARNGYTAKLFDVNEVADNQGNLVQRLSLRERDPTDYDWSPSFHLASENTSNAIVRAAAQTVPGFSLLADTIEATSTRARRPALRIVWTADGVEDVRAIEWQVRVVGKTKIVNRGSTSSVDEGEHTISTGILPVTQYEARARLIVRRARAWTAWSAATTGAVYLKSADIDRGGVHQTRLAQIDTSRVFQEPWTWDDSLDEWQVVGNDPEKTILDDSTAGTGGRAFRAGNNSGNDELRLVSNVLIPFDPTRTYKMTARPRRVTGAGAFFAGYLGIAADGVTKVSAVGADEYGNAYWHCLNAAALTGPYANFDGYTRGYGAVNGTTAQGTVAVPGTVHPDVRYLRPMLWFNQPGAAGQILLDSLTIDTVIGTATLEDRSVSNPIVQNGIPTMLTGTFQTIATITNTTDFDAMFAPTQITTQALIVVERNANDYTMVGDVFLRIRHQKRNGVTWTTVKTEAWTHNYLNFGPQNRDLAVPSSYATQLAGIADTAANGERFLFEASHGQQKGFAGFTLQAGATANVILTDTSLSTIDLKR
jgi:Putative phage tail protein